MNVSIQPLKASLKIFTEYLARINAINERR